MKHSFHHFFTISLIVITISACAPQKIRVKALEPAEITTVAKLKRVAVLEFKNDSVGIGGKIESTINNKRFNGKPYFTLVSRANIDNVLKEQKMSGLLDESSTVELGKLIGAQALIAGEVTGAEADDQPYTRSRIKCVYFRNKKCVRWANYNVNCTKRIISLNANIRVVDITKGSIIFTKSFNRQNEFSKCSDSYGSLPGKNSSLNTMARNIANAFVYKLTPNYTSFDVVLLEKPFIKYTSKQEKLLESGLAFIKANNLPRAQSILENLQQSTGGKSLVSAYNLGTVHEALGNYNEAKVYYLFADKLQTKPVAEVSVALNRIKSIIKKHQAATQQLQR